MQPRAILESCLYVNDLDAAVRFYGEVLGLALASREENRHAFFRCGNQMLLLFNPAESSQPQGEIPAHGATGPGHLAFSASPEEIQHWQQRLAALGVPLERVHHWPGGGQSLYFRDPAGNSLEFAPPEIWE